MVDTLLTCIGRVNQASDMLLRRTACQCLQELELCRPGLLSRKLGHLYEMCTAERGFVSEAYLVLFATCLRHASVLLARAAEEATRPTGVAQRAQTLSALLSTDLEPLKPFAMEHSFSRTPLFFGGQIPALGADVSTDDLRRAISLLVDNANTLTAPSLLYV